MAAPVRTSWNIALPPTGRRLLKYGVAITNRHGFEIRRYHNRLGSGLFEKVSLPTRYGLVEI